MKKTIKEMKEILSKMRDEDQLYLYRDFFITKEKTSKPLLVRLSDSNYGETLNVLISECDEGDRIAVLDSCEDNDSCEGLKEME